MDDIDRKLLNEMQSYFPISKRPFKELGEKIGISEIEVIKRVKQLKERGVIRRIGGNFYPFKLGFTSTLCAAHVPDERLEEFIEIVNSYPGVTHNYIRRHYYNVWFTFIAESKETIEKNLKEISRKTGVNPILNLPAIRLFKVRADFNL